MSQSANNEYVPMKIGVHPVANIFPEMSDEEWKNLYDDIKANGQREAIVLHKGQVIDGRNRLRACAWLKIHPKTREYEGKEEDILSYVLSLNLHRRHLAESQRAMVAAKIANTPRGGDRKSEAFDQTANLRNDQAAKMLNVSVRSVESAKRITSKGEPEVAAAVESGRMTLNEASKVVQLRPELQRQVSDLSKAERRHSIRSDTLEEMGVYDPDDGFNLVRIRLSRVLGDFCELEGTPEQLLLNCPKNYAPRINKFFRQAFMKMQALHAVYQNWEFRNVHDD